MILIYLQNLRRGILIKSVKPSIFFTLRNRDRIRRQRLLHDFCYELKKGIYQ